MGGKALQGRIQIHTITIILHSWLSIKRYLASSKMICFLPKACFTPSIDPDFGLPLAYAHSFSLSSRFSVVSHHPSSPCARTPIGHANLLCPPSFSPSPFKFEQRHSWSYPSTSPRPCSLSLVEDSRNLECRKGLKCWVHSEECIELADIGSESKRGLFGGVVVPTVPYGAETGVASSQPSGAQLGHLLPQTTLSLFPHPMFCSSIHSSV